MADTTVNNAELVEVVRRLSQPLQPQATGYPVRCPKLPEIRAVVFDIYGTLLISATGDVGPASNEEDEQAFRRALSAAGFSVETLDSDVSGAEVLVRTIHAAQATRRREGIEHPEVDILAVWEQTLKTLHAHGLPACSHPRQLRRLAVEYECRVNPVWPMPGLRETLATLRTNNKHLGIVSNAQFYTPLLFQGLLEATPAELGLESRLCAWSYQLLEGKPSTRLFRQVLEALGTDYGIASHETLYVGNDRLKDIWPAAQLGCRTALFAGDARSLRLREDDPRCGEVEPDLVIDDLRQLQKL